MVRTPEPTGSTGLYKALDPACTSPEIFMLSYALIFLVIALVAGAFGFFGLAGAAVGVAKILFFVFLVAFIVSLVFGRDRAL